MDEVGSIFGHYYNTLTTGSILLFNVAHNMGDIYDNVDSYNTLVETTEPSDVYFWQRAGMILGEVIKSIGYRGHYVHTRLSN